MVSLYYYIKNTKRSIKVDFYIAESCLYVFTMEYASFEILLMEVIKYPC